MGCFPTKDAKSNTKIEGDIQRGAIAVSKEVKLLLLGAGESGKSTIFKQMKIVHHNGYSLEELLSYRDFVRSNILQSMKALIQATHKLNVPIEDPDNCERAAKIFAYNEEIFMNPQKVFNQDLERDLKELWNDKQIQKVYARRAEYQLLDSTDYFFSNLARLSEPNYVPTEQDVLRCRVKTTGIVVADLAEINGFKFKLIDVGGQRNERKKWLHCFDDVTAIIFVTAISEYDLKCYEDDTTWRMHESLKLFDDTCNNQHLKDIPILFFFNKTDLYLEKIKTIDPKICFDDYSGGCNYDEFSTFIKNKFLSLNKNPGRSVYLFYTCATDTESVRQTMENVTKEIILKNVLAGRN